MTGSQGRNSKTWVTGERATFSCSDDAGFSLLELLLVVAILLIVATIAIPSLIRSRQSANESAAVATLQLINGSQNLYMSSARAFGDIDDLIADQLIDDRFENPKSGYLFEIALSDGDQNYVLTATAQAGITGRYDYYSSPDYVIRYSTDASRAPAGLAGQPVNSTQ